MAHLVKKASIASKPVKRLIGEDGRERKGIATVIGTGQPKRRRKDRTRADEAEYDTDYDDLDRNSTTSYALICYYYIFKISLLIFI